MLTTQSTAVVGVTGGGAILTRIANAIHWYGHCCHCWCWCWYCWCWIRIHRFPRLPCRLDLHRPLVVGLHLLPLGRVEPTESHHGHHALLLLVETRREELALERLRRLGCRGLLLPFLLATCLASATSTIAGDPRGRAAAVAPPAGRRRGKGPRAGTVPVAPATVTGRGSAPAPARASALVPALNIR